MPVPLWTNFFSEIWIKQQKVKENAFEIVDCKMSAIPFIDLSVQTLSSASPVSVQHLDSVFADG